MSGTAAEMKSEFYVSHAGQSQGPWTIQEIVALLGRGEIQVTDFIYDEAQSDWIPLLECAQLVEALRGSKPKAAPPKKLSLVKNETQVAPAIESPVVVNESEQWFIQKQKGQQRVGPLDYLSVVRALQEKSIELTDFVWKEGMGEWQRIGDCEEYAVERIRDLVAKPASQSIFLQRRYPRRQFDGEVLVHDNRHVWMGRSYQGGEGGSGLLIENAKLTVGQVIQLHFESRDALPAFNAMCEIVSKRGLREFARMRNTRAPFNYGVKFLKIDSSAEEQVREFFRDENGN